MATDANNNDFPNKKAGRVRYTLGFSGGNYTLPKDPEQIKIANDVATDVFFDTGSDNDPISFDSATLDYNYGNQIFFDVAENKNLIFVSEALTGSCLDAMNSYVNNTFSPTFAATLISTDNVHASTLRPQFQGVYDHYSDKSFFCLMLTDSNIYAVECAHSTGSPVWGTPQLVYTQTAEQDYNYPNIALLPDRRLAISYASPFDDAIGFAISDSAADVSSWTTQVLSTSLVTHEYPRILVDRKGHIFIFYSGMDQSTAAHKRWYYYMKSEDNGTTWGSQTLALSRPLDDTYGMCEMYVGRVFKQPFEAGEKELWWTTWTSSGGFQFRGVHTGGDDSATLVCGSVEENDGGGSWASIPASNIDGSGFTFRWLYNTTSGKEYNSGITSAVSGTVTPSDSGMLWDTGDTFSIAYHNINHSDLFTAGFCPEDGNWYDVGGNNLGPVITTTEMETTNVRAYTTPTVPPLGKDTGFTPTVVLNGSGAPTTLHSTTGPAITSYYQWGGSSWNVISTSTPAGDNRYLFFEDGQYFWTNGGINLYASTDTTSWSLLGNASLPGTHGYGLYAVSVREGSSQAFVNIHESNSADDGSAWGLSLGDNQDSDALVIRPTEGLIDTAASTTVRVFVTSKIYGTRSRVRTAVNSISLAVTSGSATVATSPISATAGMAEFTVTSTGAIDETIELQATATGLDSYSTSIFVEVPVLPPDPADYTKTQVASDDFNGYTDGVLLSSQSANWSDEQNGVFAYNTVGIQGNPGAQPSCTYNVATVSADQYSSLVLTDITSAARDLGVSVRVQGAGAGSYYGYYAASDNSELFRMDSGSKTILGTTGSGFSNGDTIELYAIGDYIIALKNGSIDTSVGASGYAEDTTYTTGSVGVTASTRQSGTYADDWAGGNLTET